MATQEPEPEIIELVEEVMSNEMFMAAIAIGIVAGAILFYLYTQSKNGNGISLQLGRAQTEPEYTPEPAYETEIEEQGQ